MLDNFHEEVATKQNKTFDNIAYAFVWISIVVFGIIGMMGLSSLMALQFNISSIVTTLLFGGAAVLLFLKKDNLRIEYDYTFTNGDLDVGKVFGNSRRKLCTSLKIGNVEAAGMVTDPSFQKMLNDKAIKKHNWFVNREANLSYFYFVKKNDKNENVKHCIVLELSDTMLDMVKPYLKFGVWQGTKSISGAELAR
ncbi:MAG: hypothetical protein IJJ23_03155 [Clostridia bacterium]|nr:hypothetical protein [Clostridia bacterium]